MTHVQRLSWCLPLFGALATGCMTFEATMPGVMDMREPLAKPQSEPAEPKRPAFGDDGIYEGFTFTETTEAPTKGDYSGQDKLVYRRAMRQWYIIGLVPIVVQPEEVTKDLKTELETPGTKIKQIRITSGFDLIDFARAFCLSAIPVINVSNLVPSRSTEVVALIDRGQGGAAATDSLPDPPVNVPTGDGTQPTDGAPTSPAEPVYPPTPDGPAYPPTPDVVTPPDAPVVPTLEGGSNAN